MMSRKQAINHAARQQHKHDRNNRIKAECRQVVSDMEKLITQSNGAVNFLIPATFLRENAGYLAKLKEVRQEMEQQFKAWKQQRIEQQRRIEVQALVANQLKVLLVSHPDLASIVGEIKLAEQPTEQDNRNLAKLLQDAVELVPEAFELAN